MRLLLVEDDARLAAVLREGLKEEAFTVDHASEATSGREMVLASDYDAVVLDLMLPGGDGLEILKLLRERGSAVPVLVLTARSALEDRVRGLDLGADDYLAKPFDFRELLARLRAITRRPPVPPQMILSEADLELDLTSHEVRRAGTPIHLTAREYALLEYLLRNKGMLVTRGMILDNVWGLDYDGGSNLVEVYINYLRGKLDQDFEPKLIRTVRGAGYVLGGAT
jgi:DNA-binding response OmpR family regulator